MPDSLDSDRVYKIKPRRTAFKITLIYFIVSIIWIISSDQLLSLMVTNIHLSLIFASIKGTVFVILTSILIYFLVFRNLDSIKESEDRFFKAFSTNPIAIILTEEDGKIIDANKSFLELTGFNKEEILGVSSTDLGITSEKVRDLLTNEFREKGKIKDFELEIKIKSGEKRNVLITIESVPIKGKNRNINYLHDITERKKALEEVQNLYLMELEARIEADESKKQMAMVLERISDSFVALDNNWHYTYVNKKAAEMFEKTPEEMVGQHIWTMFPEGIDQPFYKAYHKAMEEQVQIHLEEYYPPYDRWFENDIYPSEDGITIFFKEITERVKMQEEILSKERELSSIYNNISDILFSLSVEEGDNYRFVSVNKAFLDTMGLTETQVLGKYIQDVIPETFLNLVRDNYKKAIQEKRTVRWEEVTEYPIGRKYGELTITPVFDTEGHCKQLIGTVHDITERMEMQEEILFKTTLLEAQLESTMDGILVVDGNRKSILYNQRFGEMWNIPPAILESDNDKKIAESVLNQLKYPKTFIEKLEHLYAHESEISIDEIEFKDGKVFERYSAPLIDEEGKYEGRIWYFRDITDIKQFQEALIKSEKNYRELVDNSLVGVYKTNLNGDILFANQAMARLGNLESYDDLKDRNIVEFYKDPADRDRLIQILKKEGKVNQYEMDMVSDEGEIVSVLITAQISDDTISGMIIDTREKTKAEQALKVSENKYRALFDNAPVGIFLMENERFVECNEKVLEIYGVRMDQIIGQTPIRFSPEFQDDGQSSRDKALKFINQAMQGNPQHFEWKHIHYDGTPFYAEVSLNRVKIGDRYLIQAIIRDVTERKIAEELEKENIKLQELDKLKSMFIASMSHELRTPLNSIIGFTGIILQGMSGELNAEQQKQLSIVKNSANHLLSLINDVIDISKIEAGKVELFIEDFDLSNVILEIEESFLDAVSRKGLEMTVKVPESLLITGDERRTKQVVMNLVSNAVKFTDNGNVTIKVTKNKGMVEISVKDTGLGIREEDQSKLFQAFSRIYIDGQPMVEGTGLGLYLSKKIADILGGDITVESLFREGSEFIFTFPVKYSKSNVKSNSDLDSISDSNSILSSNSSRDSILSSDPDSKDSIEVIK